MAKRNKNDFYLYEKDKNLDELDTHNIGMKKPDPSSHSNIAQISETDEVELTYLMTFSSFFKHS